VPAGLLKDGPNKIGITMTDGKPVRVAFIDLAVS
jgi:hypothetical protein